MPLPAVHAMPAPAPAAARLPAVGELRGLKAAEIVSLLGEPAFRRVEPPAELWQYRTRDCVLDLFFYPQAGGYRVSAAETRGRILTGAGIGRCPDDQAFFRPRAIETRL